MDIRHYSFLGRFTSRVNQSHIKKGKTPRLRLFKWLPILESTSLQKFHLIAFVVHDYLLLVKIIHQTLNENDVTKAVNETVVVVVTVAHYGAFGALSILNAKAKRFLFRILGLLLHVE